MQVIYESLRLANLGTIIFRKAVKDVEVKGKLVVKLTTTTHISILQIID